MKLNKNILLTTCIALSLAACSPQKTSDEYMQSAHQSIAANDDASAIIAIKNAIRMDRENGEARLVLGTLYLDSGKALDAEKELKKALELGSDETVIVPKLLKALNLQQKYDEILRSIDNDYIQDTSRMPEVLLYKALAYSNKGNNEQAMAAVTLANEISADSIYTQFSNAYMQSGSANSGETLKILNEILIKKPLFSEAILLKGQLLFLQGDYDNSLVSFKNYQKLLPNNLNIRLFLANTYIKNNQFDKANIELDKLLKISPEHAFINQLKAVTYFKSQDFSLALEHVKKSIHNGIDSTPNRVLAGLSAFNLENYEQAHYYLISINDALPIDHPVKKILGVIQMELGYTLAAGETFTELEGLTAEDASLLTSASFELLKSGKIEEAKLLLKKTDSMSITTASEMTRVGILKISMNDLSGITNIEDSLKLDPELSVAKIALASVYIRNNEFDKATSLAEQWKKDQPNKADGYNLSAKIMLLEGKVADAEVQLKKALEMNDTNPYSLLYFSNQAINSNEPNKSIIMLNKLFLEQPDHIQGLTQYYRAHKLLGNQNDAIKKLAASYSNNSQNLAYRLLYVRALFDQNMFQKVINILNEFDNVDGTTPAIYWALLGESLSKVGNNQQALSVFKQWIDNRPGYRAAWLSTANTYEKLMDFKGALSTIADALVESPEDGQFNVLLAYYQILNQKYNDAKTQIGTLTKDQQELPLIQGLNAQILLTEQKYQQALPGLTKLYTVQPNSKNTALVFATLLKLQQSSKAIEFMKAHISNNMSDRISRNTYAEYSINVNLEEAKKHYYVLLLEQPDAIVYLNNLAFVEYKLENYRKADKLASHAMDIDKRQPQVLDTLALIKQKLGEKEVAIKLLKEAMALAPNDLAIAAHYKEISRL